MFEEVKPMFELIKKIDDPLVIEEGELAGSPQLFSNTDFSVGILEKPQTKNYLYYQAKQMTLAIDGKETTIVYDKIQKGDLRPSMLVTLSDFVKSSFLISVIQRLLILLLLIFALILVTLVISKFKMKMRSMIDALFIGMIPAVIVSVICSWLTAENIQLIVFSLTLGLIYSGLLKKELDNQLASYYLGEEVL